MNAWGNLLATSALQIMDFRCRSIVLGVITKQSRFEVFEVK